MNIKTFIKVKSIRMRRTIVFFLLKNLTPYTFKQLSIIKSTRINDKKVLSRPSIEIMARLFDNKKVNGVEIGVRKGYNSKNILNKININKLYLIDVWSSYKNQDHIYTNDDNYLEVKRKFSKNKKVEIIRNYSLNACKKFRDNSLDFVYIDGNHSYKYVYSDILSWYKKVKKGGIIGGHDILNNSTVLYAVRDYCVNNNISFQIKPPDWYIYKN